MKSKPITITSRERDAFAAYGAEISDFIEGEKITLKFSSTSQMLELISEIKKIDHRFSFNSKRIDGSHFLFITSR